jgi:glycosyltransferase involved in cell wall biosynthesis
METLNSIKKQTYTNWECILVDDGSTDAIENLIEETLTKDSRFTFYKRPNYIKKGASACRNYGVSLSKGEYIQFFDSDDIMHPEHLEEKINTFNSSLDFVFCRTQSFREVHKEDAFLPASTVTIGDNIYQDFVLGYLPLVMLAPMWRKTFLMKNEPLLDENITLNEDMEWHARLLYTKPKYAFVDKVLIFVRMGLDSISNRYLKDPSTYIDDFLEVKRRILKLSPDNKLINFGLMKQTLREFRACMANKDYKNCDKILKFIKTHNKSEKIKSKLKTITIAYKLVKTFGFGETRFKKYFKI